MFNAITKEPLVGQELVLSKDNIENWQDLEAVVKDNEPHQITITHNNKIRLGEMVRYKEGNQFKYALLMDQSVVLPSGVCIKVDIEESQSSEDCKSCCTDVEYTLNDETKFAVLDANGCIGGYVTLSDIINKIAIPTLCDLLPEPDERNGNLVAQDRILTISGKCNIKAVKQSDLKCK